MLYIIILWTTIPYIAPYDTTTHIIMCVKSTKSIKMRHLNRHAGSIATFAKKR